MNKLRAVIYARYSSDKQTEQSIEGQLRYCHDYADRLGYQIVGEYIDRAKSGTNDRRESFQRMIRDSSRHAFDLVLLWKLDRFARNRYDSAIYKRELRKNGVRVVSVTESVGEGDESIILEAVLEAMAETYSRQLSQNVRRGMRESAMKAKSTGGVVPLGYKLQNGSLTVEPREAEAVRYIFERYAFGDRTQEIVNALNARGFRSHSGNPLTYNSIASVLKNKKYIGVYHYDDIEIENGCPPIVTEELFQRCAARRALAARAPAAKKAAEDYILTGKLFCGHCGEPMIADSGRSKAGTVYHYYVCRKKKKRKLYDETCDKKREQKDAVERLIVESAVAFVLRPDRLEEISQRVAELYNSEISDGRREELEKRAKSLKRELNDAAEALMHAGGNKRLIEAISEKADRLDAELTEVEDQLHTVQLYTKAKIEPEEIRAWLLQFCKGDSADLDYCRRIIDTLIRAIYIYDDKILIWFNIRGSVPSEVPLPPNITDDGISNLNGKGSPRQKSCHVSGRVFALYSSFFSFQYSFFILHFHDRGI